MKEMFIGARQAAEHLNVRLDTVYFLLSHKHLAAHKDADGRWQISARDIEARLQRLASRRLKRSA